MNIGNPQWKLISTIIYTDILSYISSKYTLHHNTNNIIDIIYNNNGNHYVNEINNQLNDLL